MYKSVIGVGAFFLFIIVPQVVSAATCPDFTRVLARGDSGTDVKQLQQFLTERGLLSASGVSGYFGLQTESAVQKFQCAENIMCSGAPSTTGWGVVGSQTQTVIKSMCTSAACTPSSPETQTLACPSGQTGSIMQTRTSSCTAGAASPTWSAWSTTANTCTTSAPVTQVVASASAVPPAPTNMITSCSADATQLTYSWTSPAGYTTFYTRVSSGGVNLTTLWDENFVGTAKTIPVTPGTAYDVWVHTKAADGTWSDPLMATNVVCTPASGLKPAVLSNSSTATNWLVKDICVDSNSRPVAFDPYYQCPSGTSRRKIRLGDAVPYHNIDQTRAQQNDSFPILDSSGRTLYFHTFDFAPFNKFQINDASDGYDVHAIRDGFVSYSNTADGGGFRTTFFGANCTFGNGWASFPTSNFLVGGEKTIPIFGVYWEQAGQSHPGGCPTAYGNSLTTWKLQPKTAFGGISGNPVKTMDTMISWHGYGTDQQFTDHGHLEVFYYTQQYGLTKWEVWRPIEQGAKKTTTCAMPDTVTYKGRKFVVEHCRDWSVVVPEKTASIPVWPVVNANKLKFWHFNDGALSDDTTKNEVWHRFGKSPAGNLISWSLVNSKSALDTKYAPGGVRYLSTSCSAGSDGKCGAPGSQAIYQDLPASGFTNGSTYLYGISARTAGGEGTIQIGIQVIDSAGKITWQDTVQETVKQVNGVAPYPGASDSVYLSSKFIGKVVKLSKGSSAAKVRLLILPTTSQTFHILDAWINPYPVAKTGLSTIASTGVAPQSLAGALTAIKGSLDTLSALVGVSPQ